MATGDSAERRELEKTLQEVLEAPRMLESDFDRWMAEDADAFKSAVSSIDRFLEAHPDDPARDRLLIQRLQCLYFAASLNGVPRERLTKEVNRLIAGSFSHEVRRAAKYRLLRLELDEWRMRRALDRASDEQASALISDFIAEFPRFSPVVPLVGWLIENAEARGEAQNARPLLDFLKEHHPTHVTTKALVGRSALRNGLHRPWRPILETMDGDVVEWSALSGRIVLVVFWAPRHANSVELLQETSDLRQRFGPDRLGVVTIALDADTDAVKQKLRDVNLAGPNVCEKRGWAAGIVEDYGVQSLPTVLLLDGKSKLERYFFPTEFDMSSLVGNAVEHALNEISPSGAAAEPSDGVPEPQIDHWARDEVRNLPPGLMGRADIVVSFRAGVGRMPYKSQVLGRHAGLG